MIAVSKDDFFRAIGGPESIHPTSEPNYTVWKDLRSGEVIGRSTQGYVLRHGELERHYLTTEFATRKGIKESQ